MRHRKVNLGYFKSMQHMEGANTVSSLQTESAQLYCFSNITLRFPKNFLLTIGQNRD